MVNDDVLAAMRYYRRKWRLAAGKARKCFEAVKTDDSRYQQRGEEIGYANCADDLDEMIEIIEEAQRKRHETTIPTIDGLP